MNRIVIPALFLAAGTAPVHAEGLKADVRGLTLEEGPLELNLGGRLHLDYAFFDDDLNPIDDDFDVRRGRPLIEVNVGDDWKAKFEYELGVERNGIRAAWLQWDGIDHLKLRVGNQTLPFGLEENESSNYLVFNERSLASALGPNYGTGVMLAGDGRLVGRSRFTAAGAVYFEPFGDDGYDRHGSDQVGFAGRATFAPVARKRRVVQIGASLDYRSIRGDDDWRVSRRPESQLAPTLIGVALSEVESVTAYAFEAAAMFGPVLFQGEYIRSGVDRNRGSALPNVDFHGAYAQLSWVITGERHRYSRSLATFGGVKPKRQFGALEAALRWSTLDANDRGVLGGEADDITLGLSWWIRENARLMFNYVRVDAKVQDPLLPAALVSDEPQIFALRFVFHL